MNGARIAERLHSRYRPELEALRYVEALAPSHDVDCFILVEPGMGYLVGALRNLRPNSKVVVLHADAAFREFEGRHAGVPVWYPDDGRTAQEFLEREIPEGANARVIEWRPSLSAYGAACLELVRESADFIKRAQASRRTAAAFGARWVRNFFRNLALIDSALLCGKIGVPVVVAGSGPGLEAALGEIRAAREGVFVLASSSSLPALAAGGVLPDMAIGTDGGGWALSHLYACFRLGGAPPPKLACSLFAALPSQCAGLSVLPVSDGSLWQALALGAAGVPSALVPQRGTVAATALELALALGARRVFLAGADFSVDDIRTHARPYGFDHLFFGSASRLRPVYSQAFARARDVRGGGSHDVYAAWFKSRAESWRGRVFSLGGRHRVFERGSLSPFLSARKGEGGGASCFSAVALEGAPAQRCARALGALVSALKDPRHSAVLSRELGALLFPSRTDVGAEEIARRLRAVAARYVALGAAG